MYKKIIFLTFLFLGVVMGIKARAAEELYIWHLPSGLTAVVQPNDSAPVVAMQIWVKTGSSHEEEKEAGISHFIEHMVFKGTEHFKAGEVAKLIEGSGGSINAYTSFDYTVFHVIMPRLKWKIGLRILADMVLHATFDPKEMESEKQVVLEEIRKDKDSPYYMLSDTLFATAYKVYPYRRPIIGYTKTVKSFTRADVLHYYHKWYCPANMVAVIVGDVKANEVKTALEELFPQASDCPAQFSPSAEPVQRKLRLKVLRKPFKETYLAMGFPIPGIGHPDVYALDVLSEILGEGDSARLNVNLKLKKALVHSIAAYSFTPKGPGLFVIQAILEDKNLKPALKEIFSQIERIKEKGVSLAELEKAKLNLESNFIYDQETMEGWARTLGSFQVTEGDARKYKEYVDKIRAVTAAKIREVTCKYLSLNKLSLVVILPEESQVELNKQEIASLWPATAKCELREEKKVHKFVLENGLTLLVKENHRLPTFAISVAFMGGVRVETPKTNGICNFVARMLTRGTKSHSAVELATLIDNMAGNLDGFSGWNTFGVTGHFLSRFFSQSMQLLAEVIREPAFDPQEMEKVRSLILATIRQKEDRPSSLAISEFYKALFQSHPYHMDILGTPETVSQFTPEDLKQFYHTYAIPNNMVLAVVGDVDPKAVLKTVKDLFGDWPKGELNLPNPLPPQPVPKPVVIKKELNKEQVHFVLGNLGTTIYSEDKYALTLLDAILSGQGGRLFIELRDKMGLAYALTFLHREGMDTGMWGVYMATSKERLKEAITSVQTELKRLLQKGITQEELKRAKEYVLGNFVIGLQTNSQQALSMALNERYGLGYNYDEVYQQKIKAVTVKEVNAVIQRYITPDAYVLTLVGRVN